MASTVYTSGSKLPYIVTVTDDLGQIEDFKATVTGAVFDVFSGQNYSSTSVTMMSAVSVQEIRNIGNYSAYFICLVDTSTGGGTTTPAVPVNGYWAPGPYCLYLRFTESPDVPRLGPNPITVSA